MGPPHGTSQRLLGVNNRYSTNFCACECLLYVVEGGTIVFVITLSYNLKVIEGVRAFFYIENVGYFHHGNHRT